MTTTLPPDPYKTLGVAQDAQIPEIRSAHRKLVLKCHPDKVQDPTLKAQKQDEFQKVQQAYELLSNEKERQRYDDQVRLAELRRQMQAKANSSAPRTTQTYKFDVRTPDARPSSFKSSSGTPPSAKYSGFARSYEDTPGARIFEHIPVRREKSYESKSKREDRDRDRAAEKERERERERDRERERRKKAEKVSEEYSRRADEEAKKARKAEKKARDKDRKRDADDKKRHVKPPYIEEFNDEPPRSEKKKSSKKHEERRDRSTHRDEVPIPIPASQPASDDVERKVKDATNYIKAKKNPILARHYDGLPTAPTPPIPAAHSPFTPPPPADDDDVRRPAKSRRGSSNKRPSRETVLEDSNTINASPSAQKASRIATANTVLSASPPQFGRQSTMPEMYSHPMPPIQRGATFSGGYSDMPRGRDRSRLHAQASVESDLDGGYEPRHSRKHRSKKHRSPEPRPSEYVKVYKAEPGARTVLQEEYSRSFEQTTYSYYADDRSRILMMEPREPRESHRNVANDYGDVPYKVKTSRAYSVNDVNYSSHYPAATYDPDYQYAY